MANPTTYFGWVMPAATDLVTDLPADFNVFGQGVDTSMQGLLGGTTGQVLSKTSNTNMAFTWVTPTDQTPLTTKGDLFTFTTVDARLGIGANDTVLTADSTQATGMKWAAPSGGLTLITAQTIGTTVSSTTVTGVFSSTYENYKIVISGGTASGNINVSLQLGSTTTGYYSGLTRVTYSTGAANLTSDNNAANFARFGSANTNGIFANCDVLSPNLAKNTAVNGFFVDPGTGSGGGTYGGFVNDTTAYTAFTVSTASGTLTGGTIRVYGYRSS